MGTTHAVILARGLGTRMRAGGATSAGTLTEAQRAAADAGAKAMMPLGAAGRPLVEYILASLADAGMTRVTLVVPPDHEALRAHFTRTAPPKRLAIDFAVQAEPRGTADAVLAARAAAGAQPFLMLNADNLYGVGQVRSLAALGAEGLVAYEAETLARESAITPDRVLRYALLDIAPDGSLRAIREKPAPDDPLARASERWVSMNLWSFTPRIFDACERVTASARGELEIQDAVTIGIRGLGMKFSAVRVRAGVLDLSGRADVAIVEQRLPPGLPRY